MKIMGIDYGIAKIGIALGNTESRLAMPLKVLRYEDGGVLKEKIKRIIDDESVEKIVLGISAGTIGSQSREFGKKLQNEFKIPVVFQDETLTSQDAEHLSIEAGINRKKRKKLEDAYSAALILQDYLDSQNLL